MSGISATENYLSLLLSLPHLTPMTVLAIFFLTIARLLPLLVIVPFLAAKNVPMVIRMMFAVALVAIFLPQNLFSAQGEIEYGMRFIGLMLKELLIGTALGFIASAPFYLAQMSGSLIDHQRGSSALQVTDPTTQTQTGSIGLLYNYTLLALFYILGGPLLFFGGIAASYQIIPVEAVFSPAFFQASTPFFKGLFSLLEKMFDLSVQLGAPALVGILITDMFLGIANRLAPQVQIVFLGISLKSWVGIALLTAAWGLIINVMGKESIQWMKMLNLWVQEAAPYIHKS